jgi:mRNA interferase MazF
MEGDIALASLPQADGLSKPRPAVLLRQMPPFGDWLVCGISTQLHQRVADLDELIEPSDPDFADSGLKASSVIRLGFLATLRSRRFYGVVGSISPEHHQRLLERLSDYLRPSEGA